MLSAPDRRQLAELGYLLLPDFVPATMLEEMRERVEALWAEEGDDAGAEFLQEPGTRRLANLVDKGDVFARMIVMPEILECVEAVIGPNYKLSSLNARSTNPHNPEAQPWHADVGAIADACGYWVCNTIWMLDNFTPDNGATRMIPRSHTWRRLPPAGNRDTLADEQLVTGCAGTVVVMNTHMWHAGTGNHTDRCRRALHGFYTRGDKPQQQFQKALLRAQTIDGLSPVQRKVLALDNPENDRLSSATTRMSGFLRA